MHDHDEPTRTSKVPSSAFAIADQIGSAAGKKKLPPLHLWNPPFCGDIDMEVRRNGDWFYLGSRIQRPALVKLFSSVMRREDDDAYYLITPVEKVRIRVEDAPLLVVSLTVLHQDGGQSLQFTTLTDDVVIASNEHPITVVHGKDGPVPYVHVRDRLTAMISRPVYYELVANGREVAEAKHHALMITSAGVDFKLGTF
jgi:hypothetical protein